MYTEYNKQLMEILIKKAAAYTKTELAQQIGITRPTLNKFMSNKKINHQSLLRILQWIECMKDK